MHPVALVIPVAGILLAPLPLLVVAVASESPSSVCVSEYVGDGKPVTRVAHASVVGLDAAQLRNATVIVGVGHERGIPDQGIVVALATALQESRLRVYANDGSGDLAPEQAGIARSLQIPHDAVGHDHGSLGIFQQQWPWWGSMRELMDAATSAGLFYDALIQVPGWQGLPVTVAAQTVQHSAYADAYADDERLARLLLDQLGSGVAGCSSQAAGTAVFPLPPESEYVDQHNFGASGGHWASRHTGTDLSVACGIPVRAATAGTIQIDRTQTWAGPWLVKVSTRPGKLTTWYAHMQRITVVHGQPVAAGQQIGEVGSLGNATGCHLHFEVHPRGGSIYEDPIDPSPWLADVVGNGGS
jgi:murein DD-endopeptidase MepM/ murein hydrolase activator NlpD